MDEYKQYYYSARPSAQGKAFGRFVFYVLGSSISPYGSYRRVEIISLVNLRVSDKKKYFFLTKTLRSPYNRLECCESTISHIHLEKLLFSASLSLEDPIRAESTGCKQSIKTTEEDEATTSFQLIAVALFASFLYLIILIMFDKLATCTGVHPVLAPRLSPKIPGMGPRTQ